jgi:hypothetical protein
VRGLVGTVIDVASHHLRTEYGLDEFRLSLKVEPHESVATWLLELYRKLGFREFTNAQDPEMQPIVPYVSRHPGLLETGGDNDENAKPSRFMWKKITTATTRL